MWTKKLKRNGKKWNWRPRCQARLVISSSFFYFYFYLILTKNPLSSQQSEGSVCQKWTEMGTWVGWFSFLLDRGSQNNYSIKTEKLCSSQEIGFLLLYPQNWKWWQMPRLPGAGKYKFLLTFVVTSCIFTDYNINIINKSPFVSSLKWMATP